MEDTNFENKHSIIFPIAPCSNNPLNYTFLSMHLFLWRYTREMPFLVSNGVEIDIKDWKTVKALRPPPPLSHWNTTTQTTLSALSTNGFSNSEPTTNVQPEAPAVADNARSWTQDTFSIYIEAHTGVRNHSTMIWETDAPPIPHTYTCTSTYDPSIPKGHQCLQDLLLEKQFQVNLKFILACY